MQPARVVSGRRPIRRREQPHLALTEMQRGLSRLEKSALLRSGDLQPILHDKKMVGAGERGGIGEKVFHAEDGADRGRHQHPDIRLRLEILQDLGPREIIGLGDAERDQHVAPRKGGEGLVPNGPRIVVLHRLARHRVETGGNVAEPDLRVVGQLGHRSDRGARGPDRVLLLDRDRGPDILDRVDLGLVEQVEELPGIGAEGLDVAPLALGMQGLENQR